MLDKAVGAVNRDYNSIAATEAVPALLALLILSVAAAVLVARRRDARSALEWFVAFATIALIVSVTLFRGEVSLGFYPSRLTDWGSDLASLSRDPLGSSQLVLNVALFVPAGAVWTWLTKRPGRTLAALVTGSFLIECLQALTGAGGNDLVDLAANSLGALIGTGTALVAMSIAGERMSDLSRTRRLQIVGACALAVVLVIVGWFGGAAQRQASIRSTVEERFNGTDLRSVQEQIESDFEAVYGAVPGVRADGLSTDERVELRFPATFFSLHRCVYATWTEDDLEIRNASGDDCTRLIT